MLYETISKANTWDIDLNPTITSSSQRMSIFDSRQSKYERIPRDIWFVSLNLIELKKNQSVSHRFPFPRIHFNASFFIKIIDIGNIDVEMMVFLTEIAIAIAWELFEKPIESGRYKTRYKKLITESIHIVFFSFLI